MVWITYLRKNKSIEFSVSGFSALMQYIYCGEEKTITEITDLDLLFQIYILADKVRLRSCDLRWKSLRIRIHSLGL
jgi:hypothetical protein